MIRKEKKERSNDLCSMPFTEKLKKKRKKNRRTDDKIYCINSFGWFMKVSVCLHCLKGVRSFY